MTDDQIVEFLNHLIFDKRMKQSVIAQEIGVDRRVLWTILSKKHSVSNITRERIKRYFQKVSSSRPMEF